MISMWVKNESEWFFWSVNLSREAGQIAFFLYLYHGHSEGGHSAITEVVFLQLKLGLTDSMFHCYERYF